MALTTPVISATIELPYCWVCGIRFLETGGTDPAVIRNRHHVVPQANGGKDGPTVTLCSAHHDLLHAVAEQALSYKPFASMVQNLSIEAGSKILYLAGVVVNSTRAVQDDPNKRGQVSGTMTGVQNRKLAVLAKAAKMSRWNTILWLIEKEYAQRFPQQPT